jgi:outer membrane protein
MQMWVSRLARTAGAATMAVAAASVPNAASAQDGGAREAGDISIKAGLAAIRFDSSADVEIGGTPVDGGSLSLSNGTTASFEVEYFLSPAISASVNFGIPMETTVTGEGTLGPAGEAGRVNYGIGAATLRYHVDTGIGLSPYVGVGLGHLFIFGETDGALTNFDVDSAWAPVFQGGADFGITKTLGLYANVSYAPLKTDGRGEIFSAPASAQVTLNPTVVQGGVSFSF